MSLLTLVITTVNFHSNTNVYIRLPNKYDIGWDRYVTPFSYDMWLVVAIAACVRRVWLSLINYGHERNQNLTVSAILSYIHACFCQQVQTDIIPSFNLFIFSFPSVYTHLYTQNNSLNLNKIIKHLYTGNTRSVSAIYFLPKRHKTNVYSTNTTNSYLQN